MFNIVYPAWENTHGGFNPPRPMLGPQRGAAWGRHGVGWRELRPLWVHSILYGAVRLIVEQNAFILPIAHASAKVWGVQGAKVGLVQNFTDGSTSGQMCLSLGA